MNETVIKQKGLVKAYSTIWSAIDQIRIINYTEMSKQMELVIDDLYTAATSVHVMICESQDELNPKEKPTQPTQSKSDAFDVFRW
jgi:hypothetical protein